MSFKIASLHVRNFKCFDNKKFYEFKFSPNATPTILSGPNGFGKTTFFDAIELIFTKNITRLNTDIEDGRTNLGKNILLNTSSEFGYLLLTLLNSQNEKTTIIARIDNTLTKLTIDAAVEFAYFEETVDIENFDDIVSEIDDWKNDIADFECLKYIKEHFNVYYYVSQAESVHFLKNSISERKDSMTNLLQTESIQEKIDTISNNFTRKKSGVLIHDEIEKIKSDLNRKVDTLNSKLSSVDSEHTEVSFSPLLVYPQNCEIKKWDIETPNLKDVTDQQFADYISEIEGLSSFCRNRSDYKTSQQNEELLELANNQKALLDYTKFINFIRDDIFDTQEVEKEITAINQKLDIFKYSAFFRSELDFSKYKKDDIIALQKINFIPQSFDVEKFNNLVTDINVLEKQLGINQKKRNELVSAREKLHSVKDNNINAAYCPYCNSQYENPELLEEAYKALDSQLKSAEDDVSKEIKDKEEQIVQLSKEICNQTTTLFTKEHELTISKLSEMHSEFSALLKSQERIANIIKVHSYVSDNESWKTLDKDSQTIELKRIIEANTQDYSNKDFFKNSEKFGYNEIFAKNPEIFSVEQPHLAEVTKVKNKIEFLRYHKNITRNTEIDELKKDIKNLIVKQKKLELIRKNFDDLKKSYDKTIVKHKNLILTKLRVPLLIYTGKILQDYQNGLGVFISKDEMRFISNGDAKHDILNTFSSGQLSGFVLSFLFAMNKRYISEDLDDIGFILIDDPVQTMDDINIASFIEVLRNDFPNKQIILSTHETDKENYILYKFLKYNLKGQSFNVKDKMY